MSDQEDEGSSVDALDDPTVNTGVSIPHELISVAGNYIHEQSPESNSISDVKDSESIGKDLADKTTDIGRNVKFGEQNEETVSSNCPGDQTLKESKTTDICINDKVSNEVIGANFAEPFTNQSSSNEAGCSTCSKVPENNASEVNIEMRNASKDCSQNNFHMENESSNIDGVNTNKESKALEVISKDLDETEIDKDSSNRTAEVDEVDVNRQNQNEMKSDLLCDEELKSNACDVTPKTDTQSEGDERETEQVESGKIDVSNTQKQIDNSKKNINDPKDNPEKAGTKNVEEKKVESSMKQKSSTDNKKPKPVDKVERDKDKDKKGSDKDLTAKKSDPPRKSSHEESQGKRFEKKDKFTGSSKKSVSSSGMKESPSGNKSVKQDPQRGKFDSSSSNNAKGDGKSENFETKKKDEKLSKRPDEKDSKRYSDRRDRERNYRDEKAKRLEEKEKKKDDKKGSGDVKPNGKKATSIPDMKSKNVKSASDLEAQWQKEEDEKRQAAEQEEKKIEEAKKKEVEELRKIEEKKRKEEEDAKKLLEEEKKSIDEFMKEVKEKQDMKDNLREKNSSFGDNRPDELFYRKLDSNLRKNTAFVKKLRSLTENQKDSLVKDFESLNLTKYVGEVAAAITDAKLKMSDIPCAVLICSLMYQRYSEFSAALMDNWQKYLLHKKDEKISNPSKYRVDLRFFAELVSVGVIKQREGLGLLASQLGLLMNSDKDEHNNLSIVTSFCKHCGDDYAGLVPRKFRLLAEKHGETIPKSCMLTPERQKACRNLFGEYYQSLCKHLLKDHKELKSVERQNRKILHTKGEISQERKEHYETILTGYQKLFSNSSVFADLLDEDLPDLPEEDVKRDDEGGFDIYHPEKDAEFQYVGDANLFEDEDSRVFYENLPDLKAFIPGICFKDSEQGTSKDKTEEDTIDEDDLKVEDVEREMETEQQIAEVESKEETDLKEESAEDILLQEGDDDDTDTGSLMKMQFDAYVQSLPNCVNRELIDKAGIEFCMNFNTKVNRKKLVKSLFTVHRTRYDLLPFYSRMVATLYPCMPDLANDLVQLLKGDFRWHVRKKDQINIESKLKTVRFIGELVKFNLFPKSEALHCLKMLMFDFSHHNIEMACALLDTCGRFLYRSQDSHHRTKIYLDVMMRKKSALHLESRYTTMIENAFYYSNPPEVQQMVRKVRPPMHEYIRKLLYKDLSKTTTEKVLRQLRKLKWDDPEIAFYATKCLIAVWNLRYNSVHCAANLLAGLAPYYEHVAIQVVDGVLEDIRLGMEINHPKFNQRRVSCAKYLGELYNYRLVESSVIFKTLYSFITFGVSLEDGAPSPLDPPEHLFRIRLTCVLLETCGQYFDKGSSKKKLDCFLLYFQKYYLYKRKNPIYSEDRPFPIDVSNLVQDTMETIRPKTKLLNDYEEALKALEELENEVKPKIASVLPIVDTEDGSASETDDGLSTIQESEEMEDLSQNLSQLEMDDSGASQDDGLRRGSYSQENEVQYTEESNEEYLSESAGEDFDAEVNVITGAPKVLHCQEDEDFLSAFDKMMADNIQARSQESLKVPQMDIAVPTQIKGKSKYSYEEPKQDKSIEFMLMTRRGNKQQFTNINVPISDEFAAKFKERTQAEKLEKEKMKQVVLGIHERQEEEDYQEMIAALNRTLPTANTNRERRVRYQHPKGAPDADLIFGSKKR